MSEQKDRRYDNFFVFVEQYVQGFRKDDINCRCQSETHRTSQMVNKCKECVGKFQLMSRLSSRDFRATLYLNFHRLVELHFDMLFFNLRLS